MTRPKTGLECTEVSEIFLSYGREDSQQATGRLYDYLRARLGEGRIFKDDSSLQPGAEWPEKLRQELTQSLIVLVIIGKGWLAAKDKDHRRRIDNPEDWVYREILTALRKNKDIIPIVLEDAEMPSKQALPPSIAKLADKQSFRLRAGAEFDMGMALLVQRLRSDAHLPTEDLVQRPAPVNLGPARVAPELTTRLSLRVWRSAEERLHGALAQQALPLKRGDRVRVELIASEPAFFYLLWITSEGMVQPLFPWVPGSWNSPIKCPPLSSVSLPDVRDGSMDAWTVDSPSGFETIAVLTRDMSLGEASADLVQSLPNTLGTFPVVKDLESIPNDRSFMFQSYRNYSLRPDRPRLQFSPVRVRDPEEQVRRIFARLEERLGVYFSQISAEAFPNAG